MMPSFLSRESPSYSIVWDVSVVRGVRTSVDRGLFSLLSFMRQSLSFSDIAKGQWPLATSLLAFSDVTNWPVANFEDDFYS